MSGPGPEPIDVRVRGLRVEVGGRSIVDGVDLDVPAGTWLAVLGPNGAGKTTLVRALTAATRYDGSITVGGRELRSVPPRERARTIAVVQQHPVVPPGVTVFDYVLLGRAPYQGLRFSPSVEDRRRAFAVLQRLDADALAGRVLDTLSGGERQRVCLARALTQDTPVLVLDEPTAFLDVGHQLAMLELVAELRVERQLTLLTTLHDLSAAGQFADAVAVLVGGRLAATGSPAEVLTPATIGRHWGVDASVLHDDDGGITVVTRRRRAAPAGPDATAAAAGTGRAEP